MLPRTILFEYLLTLLPFLPWLRLPHVFAGFSGGGGHHGHGNNLIILGPHGHGGHGHDYDSHCEPFLLVKTSNHPRKRGILAKLLGKRPHNHHQNMIVMKGCPGHKKHYHKQKHYHHKRRHDDDDSDDEY